jgi:predicted phosphodiesterase
MKWLFVSSCVHYGHRDCRSDLFLKSLKEAKRRKASIALIGDTLDVGSYVGTAHQGSIWEDCMTPQEQIDGVVKLLKPYSSQISVMLAGNHEGRLEKAAGLLLNKVVADELGIGSTYKDEYFTLPIGGRRVFLAHGANKSDFSRVLSGHERIDSIVLGHTHELECRVVRRREGNSLREINLVRAGTYLQEPRYGKLALYPPNPIGGAWISIGDKIGCELGIKPRA